MNLTEQTLNILRNFASINSNIVFRGGNVIRTMSEGKNVVACATIDNPIELEFGIFDLHEFLGTLTLVDNPTLTFNKDHVQIADSSGRSRIKYYYSEPEFLTSPTREVALPSTEVKFTLDNDTLNKLKKAASTLGHTELAISGKNGVLDLAIIDIEATNRTSNLYSIDIAGEFDSDVKFKFILTIANLKFIPGDYDVSISKKLISHFKHKSLPIEYWIALEKSSEY